MSAYDLFRLRIVDTRHCYTAVYACARRLRLVQDTRRVQFSIRMETELPAFTPSHDLECRFVDSSIHMRSMAVLRIGHAHIHTASTWGCDQVGHLDSAFIRRSLRELRS